MRGGSLLTRSHLTLHERIQAKNWYPCPGWVGDPKPARHKFERWYKRPKQAWRLYWIARPALYAEMLRQVRQKAS